MTVHDVQNAPVGRRWGAPAAERRVRPHTKLITGRRQQMFELGGGAKAQISRRRICL